MGDLVRLATDTRVSLGIVLRQHGMEVIVKWVVRPSPITNSRQTIYSLEKVGDEGAK